MDRDNESPPDPGFTAYLAGLVTPARLERMQSVLAERTRYAGILLEDIFQSHNASAVLRSCDALGIQDVHVVERNNAMKVNPEIALGSAQWLSLHRHRGADADMGRICGDLKAKGYRLVATSPHADGWEIQSLPLDKGPLILMFGTELTGLSPEALALADEHVRIPMYGFVESFNISVSAAICLSQLSFRLRESSLPWRLTDAEKDEILLEWLKASVGKVEAHRKEYQSRIIPRP